MEAHAGEERIDRFRLELNAEDLCGPDSWWQLGAVYASDVCLAVRVARTEKLWDADGARQDLYARLRWLGQTACEYDLMRPVACVVDRGKVDRGKVEPEVLAWGANQDWHRGAFSLYAEFSEDLERRLEDLLAPKPRFLEAPERVEGPKPIDRLRGRLQRLPGGTSGLEQADDLLKVLEVVASKAEATPADMRPEERWNQVEQLAQAEVQNWASKVERRVEQLAEGRG